VHQCPAMILPDQGRSGNVLSHHSVNPKIAQSNTAIPSPQNTLTISRL